MNDEAIFDADFLQRLRVMFFKLRNRKQLRRIGAQQTPTAGFTREFKDHRQYTPGDDYRSIDWRLMARLEKLFIRVYEQVQEFHVHVVVDRSQSMVDPYPEKRILGFALRLRRRTLAWSVAIRFRCSRWTAKCSAPSARSRDRATSTA